MAVSGHWIHVRGVIWCDMVWVIWLGCEWTGCNGVRVGRIKWRWLNLWLGRGVTLYGGLPDKGAIPESEGPLLHCPQRGGVWATGRRAASTVLR